MRASNDRVRMHGSHVRESRSKPVERKVVPAGFGPAIGGAGNAASRMTIRAARGAFGEPPALAPVYLRPSDGPGGLVVAAAT